MAGQIYIEDQSQETRFRLNGGDPEFAVRLPAAVTGGITVRLGEGNGQIDLSGMELSRPLRIFGGDGDNTIVLGYGLNVHGHASIVNGTGLDRTFVLDRLTVDGNLTINNGSGGSEIGGDSTADIEVAGALAVTNGVGNNVVGMDAAWALSAGRISIRHGAGTSATYLAPVTGLAVGGDVVVATGSGNDTVLVGSNAYPTRIAGNVLVGTGTGGGNTSVRGNPLQVRGRIGVTAAGSTLAFIQQPFGLAEVGGGVSVSLGSGGFAQLRGLSMAGNLRVTGAAYLEVRRVAVAGSTVLTTGAGNDGVIVSDSAFTGPFALSTGAGNDEVMIQTEPSGQTAISRFDGSVSVATGAGDDTVRVGAYDPWTGTPMAWGVFGGRTRWDGGAGIGDRLFLESFNQFNDPARLTIGFEQ